MHISIGFLLATFAAIVPALPNPARLDARQISRLPDGTIVNPGSPIASDASTVNSGNPTASTGSAISRLPDGSIVNPGNPTAFTGDAISRRPDGSIVNSGNPTASTGSAISRLPDGSIVNPGNPTAFTGDAISRRPDGSIVNPGNPTAFTGDAISRRPDGSIVNPGNPTAFTGDAISRLPDGRILQPSYFPNNVVPSTFNDFGSFQNTLRYSHRSFLTIASQWQTSNFPVDWVRYQFRLWISQMFQSLSTFRSGCRFCSTTYAGNFQNIATDLLRGIQFALQILRNRYGSLWGEFTNDFRRLRVIIRIIFGLARSFGISINSWFNNINLDAGLFQAGGIQFNGFINAPTSTLFSLDTQF
ncbi:hypothetical protein DFH28DRAFT_1062353 [Melampsora americana]|nr:hypothetical protein DFH28DRAFT_1062353 [Melampsora americana]